MNMMRIEVDQRPMLSVEERDSRWRKIRWRMDMAGLDCLLIWGNESKWESGLANTRYVAGQPVPGIVLLPLEGDPVIWSGFPHDVAPYGGLVGGWIGDCRAGQGTTSDIGKTLIERKYARAQIGVVGFGEGRPRVIPETVPYRQFSAIKRDLPDVNFLDAAWILDEVRLIKSDEEIELLRYSARLSAAMADALLQYARPGVREDELAAWMLHANMVNGGEEDMNWLSSGALPPPHGRRPPASGRILEKGDIVVCEYHAKYKGYLTGAEMTVALGDPPQKFKELHRTAYESQRNGIAAMRPGRPMSEAVTGFRQPIIDAGFGSVECGLHGHGLASPEFPSCMYGGIGGGWHDHPYARIPEIEFAPNMVFATASDIYDPSWNKGTGVMLGRTVLITPEGPEELTGIPLVAEIPAV